VLIAASFYNYLYNYYSIGHQLASRAHRRFYQLIAYYFLNPGIVKSQNHKFGTYRKFVPVNDDLLIAQRVIPRRRAALAA